MKSPANYMRKDYFWPLIKLLFPLWMAINNWQLIESYWQGQSWKEVIKTHFLMLWLYKVSTFWLWFVQSNIVQVFENLNKSIVWGYLAPWLLNIYLTIRLFCHSRSFEGSHDWCLDIWHVFDQLLSIVRSNSPWNSKK